MPYIVVRIPSAVIGDTVDGMLGATPVQVTLLDERTLWIAPDEVCTIIGSFTENSRTTLHLITSVGMTREAAELLRY